MADLTNVARPYAQAVFELAQGAGDLAGWSDKLGTLAAIADGFHHAGAAEEPGIHRRPPGWHADWISPATAWDRTAPTSSSCW